MKKLSCKKRKLKYIREKNGLRDGRKIGFTIKVKCSDFLSSIEYRAQVLNEAYIQFKRLKEKYRIPLDGFARLGYDGDDFVKDQKKLLVQLRYKPIHDALEAQRIVSNMPLVNRSIAVSEEERIITTKIIRP